jgi:hypothetical protein
MGLELLTAPRAGDRGSKDLGPYSRAAGVAIIASQQSKENAMPIIIPAALLAVFVVAVLVLVGEATWRHYVGLATERSFRTYDQISPRSTPSAGSSLAA